MNGVERWTTSSVRVVVAATLLPLVGCGDSPSEPPPEARPICGSGTTLMASGDPLDFSWTPDCRAFSLTVTGPGVFWGVSAPSHAITSPVRYGETPEGALSLGFAEPMAAGEEYRIVLEVSGELLARDTVATAVYVP